jgi:3-hydroxybutyryl-CoA dehydratase
MKPAAYGFSDLAVGQSSTHTVTFTEESVEIFTALTGDRAPVHSDARYAQAMGYSDRIVHGMCIASHFSTILGMHLPGPATVIHSVQLSFVKPVIIGQTVRYTADITRLVESVQVVQLNLRVESETGDLIVRGQAQCGFRRAS